MSSNFPIRTVSSAREPGANGIVAAGHETHALDVIASTQLEPSQFSSGRFEFDLAYASIGADGVHASVTGVALARVSIPSPVPGVRGEVEYRLSGPEFTEHLPEVLEAISEGTMPDVPGAMRGSLLVANGVGRMRITEDLSSGVQTVDLGVGTPTPGGNSAFVGLRTSGEYGFGPVASITFKGTPPAALPAALTPYVSFGHSWEIQVLSDFSGYGEYVTGLYDWSAVGSLPTPSYFDELIIKSGLIGRASKPHFTARCDT
ncbi:MAG: hypothetical protein AAF689_05465 [Pseudomonadota bacterium]